MYTTLLVVLSAISGWRRELPFPNTDSTSPSITLDPISDSEKTTFTIGTRRSQLAMVQTDIVQSFLSRLYSANAFPILSMSTLGDRVLDVALSKIGEKSLFTGELELALLGGRVDLVVHSLKDLPTVLPEGLTLGAILKREDPSDAVVMSEKNKGMTLATLPEGSVIGTSSLRRVAQLKRAYPHLKIMDVRGNLNTRLAKLDNPSGPYAALILAVAGLFRLGWSDRISEYLPPSVSLHAVSQGALGIECRANDVRTLALLAPLCDRDTVLECLAERALLRTLEGGCSVPIGVNSWFVEKEGWRELRLKGMVANLDGTEAMYAEDGIRVESEVKEDEQAVAEGLGKSVAGKLLDQGAGRILEELKHLKLKVMDA